MYPYYSSSSFTVGAGGEKKSIDGDDGDVGDDDTERVLCQYQFVSDSQDSDSCAGVLPECRLLHSLLDSPTHDELYQDDNCGEKLLFPNLFKLDELSELDESNLSAAVISYDNEQPSTSHAVKRPSNESPSTVPSPKKAAGSKRHHDAPCEAITKQVTTAPILENIEQLEQYNSISQQSIRLYHRNNLCYKDFNASIYKDAIKKIDVDSDGLFKNSVLEQMDKALKDKGFIKASADLSVTYSKVRKYILEKFSPFLNDIISTTDILITPGMDISDLKLSCISNSIFFEKLREHCKEIIGSVRLASYSSLSHIFQSYINFDSVDCLNITNKRCRFSPRKGRFIPRLKELIIATISTLPDSVACKIENFDQSEIVNSLFSDTHGVLVSKSLIRNLSSFFNFNKNILPNSNFNDNLILFNELLEKIGNLVRVSCIFHEEVILPSESIVEQLSKYILSDMYGISSKFHKELNLSYDNAGELKEPSSNVILCSNYVGDVVTDTSTKEELQLPRLSVASSANTTPFSVIDTNIEKPEQITTAPTVKNKDQLGQFVMIKKFYLAKYHKNNVLSREFYTSIYEDAIKKINIDNNGLFKNSVLEKLDSFIASNGFVKSSVDLSLTYSNVLKYVLDKVSPCIDDIMDTADVSIIFGMAIADMKSSCLSNSIFFEKLRENCEKILEDTRIISKDILLNIVQSNIRFGSDGRLNIVRKKSKFLSEVKLLIEKTISNLPNDIIREIENFGQNEVERGLFSRIHGIFVSKSLIRNVISFFNSNKLPNEGVRDNLELLNNLLARLVDIVRSSFILCEEGLFLPDESTAELLSKYLLSDVLDIPATLHKKLKLSTKNILESRGSTELESQVSVNIINLDSACAKDEVTDSPNLMKESTLIPQTNSRWNPTIITSLNIYELAISMINIDKEDFENSFMDKVKHMSFIKECINKGKISIDLSVTYTNVKSYILETFYPFLKKFEEETRAKIKLHHGITLDKLEQAYISNEEFFNKLREFCNKAINRIESCGGSSLIDLMYCAIHLEAESPKRIVMNKRRRMDFREDIVKLLVGNISNVPEIITSSIKLLPRDRIIREHLSPFHDMYVDNMSLLKAKSVFDFARRKVVNDPLLSWLVDKISLDMIDKFSDRNNVKISRGQYKLINSYIFCRKLSTHSYIRKLVREEVITLRGSLSGSILIMNQDRIENADKKTRCEILDKLGADLIAMSINVYRNLCIKTYKSKIGLVDK